MRRVCLDPILDCPSAFIPRLALRKLPRNFSLLDLLKAIGMETHDLTRSVLITVRHLEEYLRGCFFHYRAISLYVRNKPHSSRVIVVKKDTIQNNLNQTPADPSVRPTSRWHMPKNHQKGVTRNYDSIVDAAQTQARAIGRKAQYIHEEA